MKKPILKKEYTRTDLVIFGNYLLSKQREKSIKAGAHYQVDKNALRNVHHADVENAFDTDNFNASVLIDNICSHRFIRTTKNYKPIKRCVNCGKET